MLFSSLKMEAVSVFRSKGSRTVSYRRKPTRGVVTLTVRRAVSFRNFPYIKFLLFWKKSTHK